MTAIVIEKGIPAPEYFRRSRKYPYDQMEIGDSFAVPAGMAESCRTGASRYGKRHGKKFSVHTTPDGVRCWRIA